MTAQADHISKPRVVYWNNMPAPYMVERLNAVAERGLVDLEVWFNQRKGSGRSWNVDESKWKFRFRYLRGIRFGHHSFLIPPIIYIKSKPDVVVSLYATPVFLLGWLGARLRGSRTMFRALKTFDSWVRRSALKECMKRYIFARVDGVETTGPDGAEYVMQYGTPPDRIFVLPHVFDVERLSEGVRKARLERDNIRESLGVNGTAFIYVGRLWQKKGLKDLIDAFSVVQDAVIEPVTLLIVGDGPDEEEFRSYAQDLNLENVYFLGFKAAEELPDLYAASDVFVFPTWGDPYGLVVDEAMVSGLPVISTDAAGEIGERIADGENGFVVPSRDTQAMADAMTELSQNDELRRNMGNAAKTCAAARRPTLWAEGFEQAIMDVLKVKESQRE